MEIRRGQVGKKKKTLMKKRQRKKIKKNNNSNQFKKVAMECQKNLACAQHHLK